MTATGSLAGRRVGITADRRWKEQADLFSRRGAEVQHGPSMRTMDLRDDRALRELTAALAAEPADVFVATTGFGVRYWLEAASEWGLRDAVVVSLAESTVVARGPKSRSALRQIGIEPVWTAPGESMAEVLGYLADQQLATARVAIQLFDPDEHPATVALRRACAALVELPVYRWLPPDDPGPARRLIEAAISGDLDAVTFTSQPAVRYLFTIADGAQNVDPLRAALSDSVVCACIGPVCAEALYEVGVDPTAVVWPEPFRLVPLVKLVESRLVGG